MHTANLSPAAQMSHPEDLRHAEVAMGLKLLEQLIHSRVQALADGSQLSQDQSGLVQSIKTLELIPGHQSTYAENVTLLLALAPDVQPDLLDRAFAGELQEAGDYPQVGGVRGEHYRGFLPTVQTALFLLNADCLARRADCLKLFSDDHVFATEQVLEVVRTRDAEPSAAGQLVINRDFVEQLITGQSNAPKFSTDFPAHRLLTERSWDDLVVSDATAAELQHIKDWLVHREALLHDPGLSKVLRSSYTCLFYGPSGSGKTLTASLFGRLGFPVYRVDLAMVVSKFIGETEKNLEKVFQRAERKNWILFFDEADALFSKRTGVRDAHDKYANQEVAYLLQRIEQFSGCGLVILASNLKGNIDAAFLRRFQSIIYFPNPDAVRRLQIWRNLLPEQVKIHASVDLEDLFRKYELSGGSIVNILQFCLIRLAARGANTITNEDLISALNAEYRKEGKTV